VDVRKIADLVVSLFRSEYPFVALELTTPQPMLVALGSERLLEHALINLVRNAVEAVHGLSDPRVLIRLGTSGSKTTIDVEDNGPGIAPELSGELFKPFFSTKPGGTGLGLFLAKTWIARMGGTLTLESAPGCTRFSILLRRPPGAP
jgi:two-component system C4-dicarboxylate transport sensor histidine kinase DctB